MGRDQNIKLKQIDVPSCDTGSSLPFIVSDENLLVFGYQAARSVSDSGCVVIRVEECAILKFGSPNDEALSGHRYGKMGLSCYLAYEVENSDWIDELVAENRFHSRHNDDLFVDLRHFIFTFHDSTLEFVTSEQLKISQTTGEVSQQVWLAFSEFD